MNSNGRFICLVNLLALLVWSPVWAVIDTQEIETVHSRGTAGQRDIAVIDRFMEDAIQELVYARDFSSIAEIRSTILKYRGNGNDYTDQFIAAAHTHIANGFQLAEDLETERCNRVRLNLLILVDQLADTSLVDLAFAWVDSESEPVRFWAIKVLTSTAMVEAVNQGLSAPFLEQSMSSLNREVDSDNPNTLELIIQFAGQLNVDAGRDLLDRIVSTRLQAYEQWSVRTPLLDAQLLEILYQHIQANGDDRLDCARYFAQLYSYVVQALIAGQHSLDQQVKNDLAAVVVGIEDQCLGDLLGRSQTTMKRAVEKMDWDAIRAEHDRLLGANGVRGELAQTLQFNYGSLPDGRERTGPKTLPAP